MRPEQLISIAKQVYQNKRLKQAIVIIILVTTIVFFIRFFQTHPQYVATLRQTDPLAVGLVLLLNVPLLICLVFVYDAILHLCGKALPWKEKFMLTSYSSIINFFGPLQSGPGVRAVYLRTKHQVRIRDYTLGTLIYYGLFATISGLFLLVGTRPWWQTVLVLLAIIGGSSLIIRRFAGRDDKTASQFHLRPKVLGALLLMTFLQVFLTSINYFVELQAVNPQIGYGQAVSYAGAANFSLFVSLTPGAIGFRESFLYFSQQLHHVATADILAANVIDRAVYVVFLLLLFGIMLLMHAKTKLTVAKPELSAKD